MGEAGLLVHPEVNGQGSGSEGRECTLVFGGFEPECEESAEKAMAPHSSTLAWKIPWTEEPGRLQSMGSLRVGHD